jgi:hypothetical protein
MREDATKWRNQAVPTRPKLRERRASSSGVRAAQIEQGGSLGRYPRANCGDLSCPDPPTPLTALEPIWCDWTARTSQCSACAYRIAASVSPLFAYGWHWSRGLHETNRASFAGPGCTTLNAERATEPISFALPAKLCEQERVEPPPLLPTCTRYSGEQSSLR